MEAKMELTDRLALAQKAVKKGNWMLRTSDDGISYGGFEWSPVGEWTEAQDWNSRPECGGGLHGQAAEAGGYSSGRSRLEFCETTGKRVIIDKDKIKVRRARILLINDEIALLSGLEVGGGLNLSGTGITQLPDNLRVGGDLYLRGTGITQLPDNLSVGGWLDLSGTGITQLPDNLRVGGSLDLSGTGITQLPDNLRVGEEVHW
jgi:hypothetical protein